MVGRLIPVLAAFTQLVTCGAHPRASTTPPLAPAVVPSVVTGPSQAVATVPSALPDNQASAAAPPEPATVERVDVVGDRSAWMVRGKDGASPRIVFMPGICSSSYAYLMNFREAARAHGGVVSVDGDLPCGAPNSGYHSFSWDPVRQRSRLEKALVAAGVTTIPREGLTLVGYSAGAGIGELMAARWPDRYSEIVLIGAPSDPSTSLLAGARAVATMSCSRDVPARMKDAAKRLLARGIPASYFEMPGCTHGNIADGDRVFLEAFDWLDANARPPREDARELSLLAL
jgi:pimeloyl-ACP methyl ester carboxylesterase